MATNSKIAQSVYLAAAQLKLLQHGEFSSEQTHTIIDMFRDAMREVTPEIEGEINQDVSEVRLQKLIMRCEVAIRNSREAEDSFERTKKLFEENKALLGQLIASSLKNCPDRDKIIDKLSPFIPIPKE